MIYSLHYLKDPRHGNYGIFLIMGNVGFTGFISSTVVPVFFVKISLYYDVPQTKF